MKEFKSFFYYVLFIVIGVIVASMYIKWFWINSITMNPHFIAVRLSSIPNYVSHRTQSISRRQFVGKFAFQGT